MPNDRRPMDIRCKTLFTVLCALLMMLFPPFTAHAEETADTDSVIITFDMSGAPAGTAYVDILGKISPDSEYYTELQDTCLPVFSSDDTDDPVNISADTEIAAYNADGYMSLSLHFRYGSALYIRADENGKVLEEEYVIQDIPKGKKNKEAVNTGLLYKKFGRFRCAYISAAGEVLEVTDTAVSTLVEDERNTLTAKGNAAEYKFHSDNADMAHRLKTPTGILSLGAYVLFYILIIALGIIVIRNLWKFIKMRRK